MIYDSILVLKILTGINMRVILKNTDNNSFKNQRKCSQFKLSAEEFE